MRHAAFVISLERATERFAYAQTLLSQLSLDAEILPAVDGSTMSVAQTAAIYRRSFHKPQYPFALRAGEIGCFLSHRNAWQQIVDRNLDAALILEDDVNIDQQQLNRALELAADQCPEVAYVQFPVRQLPNAVRLVTRGSACRIVCPQVTPLRTSGQWVTRAAAECLLQHTQVIDRPVDTFLQMHWITRIQLTAIEPCGLSDLTSQLGSTIGVGNGRRLTFEKLSRAVNRSWYRFQIAQLSERKAG